jgi:thiamine-monophosphate kinase
MSQEKTIQSLGEFGLIRHLTQNIQLKNKESLLGVGDDAAVADYQNQSVVITTDLLTEGVHFDLTYTPLKHLGYKSVVVNLSDVYAMNAIPKQITIAIAISAKIDLEMIEKFYAGVSLACEKYGVDLIGGDTSSSMTGMTISVTAIGVGAKESLCYRNGAAVNDLICVSGDLGAAYMGLLLLEREKRVLKGNQIVQPEFSGYEYLLERFLKPEARKEIIQFFDEKKLKPNAMIDISDGLSSEVLHLCQQSKLGCRIWEDRLPIDVLTSKFAEELNIIPTTAAMNGGEDYELLFTLPPSSYDLIKDNTMISVVGHMTSPEDGCYLITKGEQAVELKAQGWNPLKA